MMRFKLILRRSEILPLPPLLGLVVLMMVVLLLTHTTQTHLLSSSLQWMTCGTSSQEGKHVLYSNTYKAVSARSLSNLLLWLVIKKVRQGPEVLVNVSAKCWLH